MDPSLYFCLVECKQKIMAHEALLYLAVLGAYDIHCCKQVAIRRTLFIIAACQF